MAKSIRVASQLIGDFNSFVEQRSTLFLTIRSEVLESILGLHFDAWKNEHSIDQQQDSDWIQYAELRRLLESVFRKMEIQSLKSGFSFPFFKVFQKHIEERKTESIVLEGIARTYLDSIVQDFFRSFAEHIWSAPDKFDIWAHYFPNTWKVTQSNLKNNPFSARLLKCYMDWALHRIQFPTKKVQLDVDLDEVSRGLFPDIDPILWAKLLTFVFRPWSGNRMDSLVREAPVFGFTGRTYVAWEDGEKSVDSDWKKQVESEENNALQMGLLLFKRDFNVDLLDGYLEELDRLDFPEGSNENRRVQNYRWMFENMISMIKIESTKLNETKIEDSEE